MIDASSNPPSNPNAVLLEANLKFRVVTGGFELYSTNVCTEPYDRCTIDVIITKFFPLCFKMVESFENLDNILHDWAIFKATSKLFGSMD